MKLKEFDMLSDQNSTFIWGKHRHLIIAMKQQNMLHVSIQYVSMLQRDNKWSNTLNYT